MITVIKVDEQGNRTYVRVPKNEVRHARRVPSANLKQVKAILG